MARVAFLPKKAASAITGEITKILGQEIPEKHKQRSNHLRTEIMKVRIFC
jgi:hypothetical protein